MNGYKYNNDVFRGFPRLWLDRNRFQQVMFNLLSNAIKYAFDDPRAFAVQIDGAIEPTGFVIWFRDWGPGIKAGTESKVFEEGFRGEGAIGKNVTGQGLGLWIVRQIVEKHGGAIEVTSIKQPTEFTIQLPRWLELRAPS